MCEPQIGKRGEAPRYMRLVGAAGVVAAECSVIEEKKERVVLLLAELVFQRATRSAAFHRAQHCRCQRPHALKPGRSRARRARAASSEAQPEEDEHGGAPRRVTPGRAALVFAALLSD
jgi:hypothetical protein